MFRRRLEVGLKKWGLLTAACAKLHNFCIDHNDKDVPPARRSDIEEDDVVMVIHNEEAMLPRHAGLRHGRRAKITEEPKIARAVRPTVNTLRKRRRTR